MSAVVRCVLPLLALAACNRVFGVDPGASPPLDAAALRLCCVPADCGNEVTREACEALECAWSDEALCAGSHATCDAFKEGKACGEHQGCGWSPAVCQGDHPACDTYGSAVDCVAHGCTAATQCTGTPGVCSDFNGNRAACMARMGCNYDNASDLCRGDAAGCEKYLLPGACMAVGCTLLLSECTDKPHPCEAHGETDCASSGCSLDEAVCAGTPQEACSGFDVTTCPAHGCTWSPMGGCAAPTTCSERSLEQCDGGGCDIGFCAP